MSLQLAERYDHNKFILSEQSPEDRETWRSVWQSISIYKNFICKEWHQGVEIFSICEKIPSLADLEKISYCGGMELSLTPPTTLDKWFYILSLGKFPTYSNMRAKSEVLQAQKPDFCHDMIGHIPYLYNDEICSAVISFANDWMRATKEQKERLIILWFYILEFGVIQEVDGNKIFGSGLITSAVLAERFKKNEIMVISYDFHEVMEHEISPSGMPSVLFVFQSISHAIFELKKGIKYVV